MRRRKLTPEQVELVRAIAAQRRETPTNAQIAARWGVSVRLIEAISGGLEYAAERQHGDFYSEVCHL